MKLQKKIKDTFFITYHLEKRGIRDFRSIFPRMLFDSHLQLIYNHQQDRSRKIRHYTRIFLFHILLRREELLKTK